MTAPYQVMPALTPDEMVQLHASIRVNGIVVPIAVTANGESVGGVGDE